MSPQAAFIAGREHAATDRDLRNARAFWLGALCCRRMIRQGRLDEATPVMREMIAEAKFLLAGPESGHALGKRMLRTTQEIFAEMAMVLSLAERAQ